MSYAGTSKGGTAAILAAEDLRAADRKAAGIDAVDPVLVGALLPAAIDRVMGEAGLWDEEMAATALLQGGGDLAEAVHLLRAHRSTLPRLGSSRPLDPDDLELLRRVVPATREPLGPQLLGDTADYSARLLRGPGDDDPLPRTPEMQAVLESRVAPPSPPPDEAPRRYSEVLRHRELLVDRRDPSDPEPADLALHPVHLPASRSAILSAIATAETGGLVHLWYRSILGPDGYANEHVTLGDVRYGRLPVRVTHPLTGGEVTIGRVRITDCECVAHLDERGEDASRFELGYAMALGRNERKAIAGSVLDVSASRADGTRDGDALQQILMLTTDGLASNGFLEHLKLPHYVTFTSQVDRALAARQVQEEVQEEHANAGPDSREAERSAATRDAARDVARDAARAERDASLTTSGRDDR